MTTNAAQILQERRAQLARLHPLKIEHRQRAEELYQQVHSLQETAQTRGEERQVMQGHPYDLFPTPADLAADMVERADCHGLILEPSAGTGRIAEAIKEAGFAPVCVELNYNAAELLRKRGYVVTTGDFLEYDQYADTIIMNPPFSNGADIDHVTHALELLNPGGRLVAIMSPHAFFAQDQKSQTFRELFSAANGQEEDLPAGTFRASGTMVNAKLVIMDKE